MDCFVKFYIYEEDEDMHEGKPFKFIYQWFDYNKRDELEKIFGELKIATVYSKHNGVIEESGLSYYIQVNLTEREFSKYFNIVQDEFNRSQIVIRK